MRDGLTILPGFIRPRGSSQDLISPSAAVSRGPKNGAIHSERTNPSPCSPEYAPLYCLTNAQASSAMARIFSAPSRRMSSTGRTCSVPTEACAYQVPRVPCFSNTRVRRSVYSARCSSGTAQSSMKAPGLLPWCVRDLHYAAGQTEIAHELGQLLQSGKLHGGVLAGKLDQQDRVR